MTIRRHTENLWLGITMEDPDEAVQSSDPLLFIIHLARGDRRWASLFRDILTPIYSREQGGMPCSIVEWITREWKQIVECEWIGTEIKHQSIKLFVPPTQKKVTNLKNKYKMWKYNVLRTRCSRLVPTNAVLLENKEAWPPLCGENTLWRHYVSGRQNWQAATDNNIWNKFDVWNSICSDRDGCSIRLKL